MKVGNKLLNRIVAVGMLAVVLFCTFSFPSPYVVRASSQYHVNQVLTNATEEYLGKYNSYSFQCLGVSADMYSLYCTTTHTLLVYFLSDEKFDVKYTILGYRGTTDNHSESASECHSVTNVNGHQYFYHYFPFGNHYYESSHAWDYSYNFNSTVSLTTSEDLDYADAIKKIINFELYDDLTEDTSKNTDIIDKRPNGSQNNPFEKENFGYPQIYNSTYIHNDPNNLETLDKLCSGQDFQWKKKTTTGFDLTNNDYNYTYIECKVKANYQYNDKYSGKGSWHDFASYGEMGNLGKVRAESLSHYYTFQEFQEALPKTSNELPDHKMRAIKSSAVYYFRVVCMKTSSTVVIPDEKDCKYYCGPWRSSTVTKINGKDGTSIVEDGNMDENGEWKKDDSSNDNGKDIDNGSAEGDDLSDASDKAHETINSNANKSTLDLDSAKAFINQVADVPKMIGDIFSFLPDWVKYSFAFGFALIPILIIFKLIRG